MSSENALLCWPNRADEATLSGGSWGATLNNVKTRFTAQRAVSSDTLVASTKFTATFSESRFVRVVALYNHNISVTARVKITMRADDNDVVAEYEADAWPTMFLPEQTEWEADNWWDGKVSSEDLEGLPPLFVLLTEDQKFCRSVQVEIADSGNQDGHVAIGRLVIAPQWQPALNISYGAAIGWEDPTGVSTSLGGVEFFRRKRKYRVAAFRLENMSYAEGTNMAMGMTGRLGISGEVFFVMNPNDPLLLMQRSFNGRLRSLSPLEHPAYGITDMGFEIKEVV